MYIAQICAVQSNESTSWFAPDESVPKCRDEKLTTAKTRMIPIRVHRFFAPSTLNAPSCSSAIILFAILKKKKGYTSATDDGCEEEVRDD